MDETPIGQITATTTPEGSIGKICWFSVRGFEVERSILLQKWVEAGLPESEFLPEPRKPDCFKQSVKMAEMVEWVVEDVVTRHIVRHIDGKPNERHIVREHIKKGDAKPYKFEDVGMFLFVPETGTLQTVWHGEGAVDAQWQELVAKVGERYLTLIKVHNDIDVRSALQKKLRHWHSLLMRPTGGVYFVPRDFAGEAAKWATFLRSIGSEMWALSVAQDAAPMVREKFAEAKAESAKQVEEVKTQITAETNEKKKKSMQDYINDELGRIADMSEHYGSILN